MGRRAAQLHRYGDGFARRHNQRMNPSIAAHQALPAVGLHGLALAGYPPRRWAARLIQVVGYA